MWNKMVIITILTKSVWWPYIQSACWCYCWACPVHIYGHHTDFVRTVIKTILFHIVQFWYFKDFINLNAFNKSSNWYTYVTWQGNEYELSEDDTSVETCRSVIIYKFIVIVLLLVDLQNSKKCTVHVLK